MVRSTLETRFRGTGNPLVLVDGQTVSYSRIGSGYNRLLKIDLNTDVTSEGMKVYVGMDPVSVGKRNFLSEKDVQLSPYGSARFYDVRGRCMDKARDEFTGILIRHSADRGVLHVLNADEIRRDRAER